MPLNDRLIEIRSGHIDTEGEGSPHMVAAGVSLSIMDEQPDGSIAVMHIDVAGTEDMVPFSVGIDLDRMAVATLVTAMQTTLIMSGDGTPAPRRDRLN